MDKQRKLNTSQANHEKTAFSDDYVMSVRLCAYHMNTCENSIRHAFKTGRLAFFREGRRIYTTYRDLKNYLDSRWDRKKNYSEDEVSVQEAAKIINCDQQKIYYLIRKGFLLAYCKRKKMIAIKKNDLKKFIERESRAKQKSRPAKRNQTSTRSVI